MLIVFWLFASLMIAAALLVVLPPLLRARVDRAPDAVAGNVAVYRARLAELDDDRAHGELDAEAHDEARLELQRELLADGAAAASPPASTAGAAAQALPAVVTALLLPVLAFGLYFQLGEPGAMNPAVREPPPVAATGAELHSVDEMIAGLQARLAAQPDDPDGWVMLGRTLARLNRLEEAGRAFVEADARRPDHPLTLVAYAEVLAGLNGNRIDGESLRLIERALAIDPDFARGLWLAGVAYFNAGDRAAALAKWRRLQSLGLQPDAAAQVARAIEAAGGVATAAVAAASVEVQVSLDPALAARVQPDDTVFVFARAAAGPRMPLAISRHRVSELPITVTLDDSLAMSPQMRLSAFPQVVVGARVSRSGNATPSSGDLQGQVEGVQVAAGARAAVVIADVVP